MSRGYKKLKKNLPCCIDATKWFQKKGRWEIFFQILWPSHNIWTLHKVCIIRLVHIFKKNLRLLFDKYAVARTEHDTLVKSKTKIFSNFVAFSENLNFNIQGHLELINRTLMFKLLVFSRHYWFISPSVQH